MKTRPTKGPRKKWEALEVEVEVEVGKEMKRNYAWGGIRDSLDFLSGVTFKLPPPLLVLCNQLPPGDKLGGWRPDNRRRWDYDKMYLYELYCKTSSSSAATFECPGCKSNSFEHTCPHEIMQCLSVVYMESK